MRVRGLLLRRGAVVAAPLALTCRVSGLSTYLHQHAVARRPARRRRDRGGGNYIDTRDIVAFTRRGREERTPSAQAHRCTGSPARAPGSRSRPDRGRRPRSRRSLFSSARSPSPRTWRSRRRGPRRRRSPGTSRCSPRGESPGSRRGNYRARRTAAAAAAAAASLAGAT